MVLARGISLFCSVIATFVCLLTTPRMLLAQSDSTIEGELLVTIAEDLANGPTAIEYHLSTPENRIVRLIFSPGTAPKLESGSEVVATGTFQRDVAGQAELVVARIIRKTPAISRAVSGESGAVAGARRALVFRVNFRDVAVSCSADQIGSTMWTGTESIKGLYEASSFGALTFPSDTNGDGLPDVVDVNIDALSTDSSCNYYAWSAAANEAAASKGVNLSLYQHRVYVLPSNVPCGWAGMGNVGCGASCSIWVKACQLPDVYAHELGHNLGMQHAATDTNNDGTTDCEYCDKSCV